MKTAKWIMFSPENGGVVRLNVAETIGTGKAKRELPGEDVTVPFDDLSRDVQSLVLDTFATLAAEAGATTAPVTPRPE